MIFQENIFYAQKEILPDCQKSSVDVCYMYTFLFPY